MWRGNDRHYSKEGRQMVTRHVKNVLSIGRLGEEWWDRMDPGNIDGER